eukprot:scaffold5480_cov33-Phaeocystis_antarctica.AAC.1
MSSLASIFSSWRTGRPLPVSSIVFWAAAVDEAESGANDASRGEIFYMSSQCTSSGCPEHRPYLGLAGARRKYWNIIGSSAHP